MTKQEKLDKDINIYAGKFKIVETPFISNSGTAWFNMKCNDCDIWIDMLGFNKQCPGCGVIPSLDPEDNVNSGS